MGQTGFDGPPRARVAHALIDEDDSDPDVPGDPEDTLAASAILSQTPPAGPQWVSGQAPLEPHALAYDKALCASLDGITSHAATRAGALDSASRAPALLRSVLRPPIAQERRPAARSETV